MTFSQPARTAVRGTRPTVYRVRRDGGVTLPVAGMGGDTSVILAAAGEAVTQLVESVGAAIRLRTIAAPAAAGGPGGDAGRHGPPLLLAPDRRSAQN